MESICKRHAAGHAAVHSAWHASPDAGLTAGAGGVQSFSYRPGPEAHCLQQLLLQLPRLQLPRLS